MSVADYLGRPPTKGTPCLLWVADWVVLAVGADLAAGWRGMTPRRWLRAMVEAGGIEAFARARVAAIGLQETQEPRAGDIGLVEVLGDRRTDVVGAIYSGRLWGLLIDRDIVAVPALPKVAWSV